MRLINRKVDGGGSLILGALPFILLLIVYVVTSDARLDANANDKLLPSLANIADAVDRLAFQPDKRKGEYTLWVDTAASLGRLAAGLSIATAIGLVFGIAIGLLPLIRSGLAPVVTVICMVPPLAILPILFIIFGLGEVAKVVLIVIGIAPFMIRDLSFYVAQLPSEQLIKAQTLGASTWQIVTRVALPQMLPKLVSALRLSLGPAWLFLISSEAIAATEGLGYRIFLVRRYLAMDVIIPYVIWITILAFALDYILKHIALRAFKWQAEEQAL
jgi:NitT/TauT family transport system permease protein